MGNPGESEDSDVFTKGFLAKEIKWECFTDNGVVADLNGMERATKIFMDQKEAELSMSFSMGDGVAQSHRGVAPRWVVKEGNFVTAFKLTRKQDADQQQEIQVAFEVKYEFN